MHVNSINSHTQLVVLVTHLVEEEIEVQSPGNISKPNG